MAERWGRRGHHWFLFCCWCQEYQPWQGDRLLLLLFVTKPMSDELNNLPVLFRDYAGSKAKYAHMIMKLIVQMNQSTINSQKFIDLFAGGTSVSLAAIQSKQFVNVILNDYN